MDKKIEEAIELLVQSSILEEALVRVMIKAMIFKTENVLDEAIILAQDELRRADL